VLAVALGGFVVAASLMVFVDATWALIVGVSGLLGSVAVGFVALANLAVAAEAESDRR
jgi:hypothetical protein